MRTSTIDHSPVSPERSDVAPATAHALGERAVVHTHEQHEVDLDALRAQFATVSNSVRKNTPINYNYPTLAKGGPRVREDMLWRQHKWVEEPLMQLWQEYTDAGQPFGDFVSTVVGVRPNQELTKSQKQHKSVIMASIRHGVAVRQVRALLDEHDVQYELPDEAAVRSGADLIIGSKLYRFKTMQGATSLISAEVPRTYRRTLPSPFLSELPADYQIPPYTSNKVISGILSSFGVSATKTATRENIPPIPTRQDTIVTSSTAPTPKKPATPVASIAKRKRPGRAERQAAHQRLLAEHAAAKAAKLEKIKKTVKVRRIDRYGGIEPIIISPRSHQVRIHTGYTEPPYATKEALESLVGERYALSIIDEALEEQVIDGYKITSQRAGDLIRNTIKPESTKADRALKELARKICKNTTGIYSSSELLAVAETLKSSELRDFIAHIYTWSHPDSTDTDKVIASFMESSAGFRIEASFIKAARLAGYEVTEVTKEQDYDGIDCFVDGIPFDIKASRNAAASYTRHHKKDRDRIRNIKFVPPFTADDFGSDLLIPDERLAKILEETNLHDMIEEAIAKYINEEYRPSQTTDIASATTSESERQAKVDQELDKIALNATRYWKRRRDKAAAAKWGDNV